MTLVDTNILIDLSFPGSPWNAASRQAFERCCVRGPVKCVDVVFAELSSGFPSGPATHEFLDTIGVARSPMTDEALWLASQAFTAYRRRGGARANVLPDFFIGAQAQVLEAPLLTRDEGRYRAYFPQVELIIPAM